MGKQYEMTLEELLHDPVIQTVMQRDGVCPEDIRLLARQAMAKTPGVEDVLWAAAGSPGAMTCKRDKIPNSAPAVRYPAYETNGLTPLAM